MGSSPGREPVPRRGRSRGRDSGRRRGGGLHLRWTRTNKLLLGAVGALGIAVGAWAGLEIASPPPAPDLATLAVRLPAPPTDPTAVPPSADAAEAPTHPAPRRDVGPATTGGPPRVALVIDDLGRSIRDIEALGALGVPLTYAVLPFESRTGEVVAALRERGAEILVHLPMEAANGADPGPGALISSMGEGELAAATARALDAVPGAAGVNNHMGSALSPRRDAMTTVLRVVGDRGLYFLDSRTSAQTIGYELARELGLPATERQVFLDNDREPEAVRAQFRELLAIARERGSAVGIAHPYPETFAALTAIVPEARAAGIEFVTAGAVVDG